MAEEDGMVVFQRGHDEADNNIWDDTALIEAYDKAIRIMKSGLNKNTDGTEPDVTDNSTNLKKKRKSRRKHKKKEKPKPPPQEQKWTVGSLCRCIYTEDGQMYEATILSMDQEAATCYVQYLGYGNEEEQNLRDLLPSAIHGQRSRRDTQSLSENDSMDCTSPGVNLGTATPSSHRRPQQLGPSPGWTWPPPPPTSPFTMPGMPPPFSAMPPLFPSSMATMPGPWPGLTAPSFPRLPSMPPPPVPPVTDDLLEADSDALSSMLMAWYMSGYHTGYYQGLKAGKKATVSPQGQTQSSQNTPQKSETG